MHENEARPLFWKTAKEQFPFFLLLLALPSFAVFSALFRSCVRLVLAIFRFSPLCSFSSQFQFSQFLHRSFPHLLVECQYILSDFFVSVITENLFASWERKSFMSTSL
mmetsp:Transcript_18139/g.54511  ORF Transcript_18139/g.54511 Transcript_18139/m.54511 type:complete len:108 (+) Transcript_18139:1734-2057(+)